jgi:nucleoside phosphorylase
VWLPTEPIDLLIVAAFEPELAPLRAAPALGAGLAGRLCGRVVAARAVGVGMPAAAAGAASAIVELGPGVVVLVGTCGAYRGSQLAIGDVVVADGVRVGDATAVDGRAEFPAPMLTSLASDLRLRLELVDAGARVAHVATTLGITVDDASAGRIAKATDSQVEHLEAFGVAAACAARRVPFAAVLGVANFVGSGARSEWREHHHAAAEAVARCVLRWLGASGRGAAGPP